MENIRLLLVDDEQEACANLRNILLEYVDANLEIVGVAHDTKNAEIKINQLKPDAVFLDIEMPNENAFQFLKRLSNVDFEIIFITAYDEYAVQAFRLNAVDYILKPINIAELGKAVTKLKERIAFKLHYRSATKDYSELAQQISEKKAQTRITLKDKGDVEIVAFVDIVYVVAMGSYSKIIFKKNKQEKFIVMSNSIAEYQELFPPEIFYRIHKSHLVNTAYIQTIVKEEQAYLLMNDGTKLAIGRRRLSSFLQFLKDKKIAHV